MSRTLLNAKLYLCGQPGTKEPARSFIEYQLRDDQNWNMRKREIWIPKDPDWSKPIGQFIEDELLKIEEQEGLEPEVRHASVRKVLASQQTKVE